MLVAENSSEIYSGARGLLELPIIEGVSENDEFVIEPRMDTKFYRGTSESYLWPKPGLIRSVGHRIRILNSRGFSFNVDKGQHVAQICDVRKVCATEITAKSGREKLGEGQLVPGSMKSCCRDRYKAINLESSDLDAGMVNRFIALH